MRTGGVGTCRAPTLGLPKSTIIGCHLRVMVESDGLGNALHTHQAGKDFQRFPGVNALRQADRQTASRKLVSYLHFQGPTIAGAVDNEVPTGRRVFDA